MHVLQFQLHWSKMTLVSGAENMVKGERSRVW